jgi:hypothetical protein
LEALLWFVRIAQHTEWQIPPYLTPIVQFLMSDVGCRFVERLTSYDADPGQWQPEYLCSEGSLTISNEKASQDLQ